jgi:voltage-gated potassium channel
MKEPKEGVYAGLFERLRSGFSIAMAGYILGVLALYSLGCVTGMNAGYGRSVRNLRDDLWSVHHCIYAVGISFASIGYSDILGTDDVRVLKNPATGKFYSYNSHDGLVPAPGSPPARMEDLVVVEDYSMLATCATLVVCFGGMAAIIYAVGAITAFFVGGGFLEMRARIRMQTEIGRLKDHVIVCGAGSLGIHAVERLVAAGMPLLVVDNGDGHIDRLRSRCPRVPYIRGDGTDLDVLRAAGLEKARGVVASLPVDNDNLVVVVTARQENPKARVLARASEPDAAVRLRRAGAHGVVAPGLIGGMRVASEAIRPTVVRFIDLAFGHEEEHQGFQFTGLRVPEGSPHAGRRLGEIGFFEATGLRVIALKHPGEDSFLHNPGPDAVLRAGTAVAIVAGNPEIEKAKAFLAGGRA